MTSHVQLPEVEIAEGSAPDNADFSVDHLLEMYRWMFTIRCFEDRTSRLYRAGTVPGFVHISTGQEASAVGVCWPLRRTDGIVTNHRGHGHCLAKGSSLRGMFAELMGRSVGTGSGMGGSMHIADFEMGVYGANGIVGAGLPIAVGVAEGFRQQQRDDVVIVFFGDGAITQGTFHEAMNLAAIRRLPVLFVCENNGYSEFSAFADQHPVRVVDRALAYGVEAHSVDGNDVVEVASQVTSLVERMREGEGPFLLECRTYRWNGHYEGDPTTYRSDDELLEWKANDPLLHLRARLEPLLGDRVGRLDEIEARVHAEVAEAESFAEAAPPPDLSMLYSAVGVPRAEAPAAGLEPVAEASDKSFKMMNSIHDALEAALEDDSRVFVAGIDVAGGNVFGLTRGLRERFGSRIFDTPISESAIIGLSLGAAMTGCRPVVEIMYMDFIGVAFDQILNQVAKIHFMTGGRAPVQLVIRTQFGSGRSSAAQHSQSLEALLAHIPGLTVVMPSTPEDAYGLLRSAIKDPNPVVFVEHRLQYARKGVRPPRDHEVPIGRAAIRRLGNAVTLVSWSRMVETALAAAELAAAEGIDVEVIDLRTVAPLDTAAILASVRKTSRLVIAHEAVGSGGLGAEIAARVADAGIWHIDAPIKRVAAPFTPAPYSPALERDWLPDVEAVLTAVREVFNS